MSELDTICAKLNKDAGSVFITKGLNVKKRARIPFSSAYLNHMFYGGVPRGCICEFYGDGGGGKTTTSLDLVANAQLLFQEEYEQELAELNGRTKSSLTAADKSRIKYLEDNGPQRVVFMDSEGTLDVEWANTLGVELDDVYIITPEEESAEQLLQMMEDIVRTNNVGLFILDSIGSLFSEQEGEKKIGERTYCGIAGPLTVSCKKVSRVITKNLCTVIMINQIREDIDAQYVRKKTPGGKAFKHFCSIRVEFVKGNYIDAKGTELTKGCESPAGNLVKVHIEKSKVFPMNRKEGSYTLLYETGIDFVSDLIDMCVMHRIIDKGGAWYSIKDPETGQLIVVGEDELKFQGKANIRDYLLEDPTTVAWLTECLNSVNN